MLATAEMTFQGHPRSSQTTWHVRSFPVSHPL